MMFDLLDYPWHVNYRNRNAHALQTTFCERGHRPRLTNLYFRLSDRGDGTAGGVQQPLAVAIPLGYYTDEGSDPDDMFAAWRMQEKASAP